MSTSTRPPPTPCINATHDVTGFDEPAFRAATLSTDLWDLRADNHPETYALLIGLCPGCRTSIGLRITGERADELLKVAA